LKRSDSIRNSCSPGRRSPITVAQKSEFRVQCGPTSRSTTAAGTEFLDAETKRQKPSFKRANARRDPNPGTEWPEIPTERAIRCRAGKVRFAETGWWRHSGTNWRPTTQSSNRSLRSASGNGIFRCGDRRSNPPFCLPETEAETGANSKKPAIRGTNARIARGVRYLKTGWWCAQSDTNPSPCYRAKNRVIFEKNREPAVRNVRNRCSTGIS